MKVFWLGVGIYYGYIFLIMLLEMTIPGMPLARIGHLPISFLYNQLGAILVVPAIVAILYWYLPMQEEKRRKEQGEKKISQTQEVKKNG
jgi:hypothetical protein